MFFDHIIKKYSDTNPKLNEELLWEYDLSTFDTDAMRRTVVQRVVERGREEDWMAIFHMYGGVEKVKEIIKEEVPWLSPKDMSFVCHTFNLKKEDLKCYTKARLREQCLNQKN